jgi:hypothetical protein
MRPAPAEEQSSPQQQHPLCFVHPSGNSSFKEKDLVIQGGIIMSPCCFVPLGYLLWSLSGRPESNFFVEKSWSKSQSAAMTAAADNTLIGLWNYCSAELFVEI